jgi:hypothetical protein
MAIYYIARDEWGAPDKRLGYTRDHEQFRGLVIHHTVTPNGKHTRESACYAMRNLVNLRPDLGKDIPYSFVMFEAQSSDDDVFVCEGRGFGRSGAHTEGLNSTRYGIALWGNYTDRWPTHGQIEGVRWIGAWLTNQDTLFNTVGHKQTIDPDTGLPKATACPGNKTMQFMWTLQPPFYFEEPDVPEPVAPKTPAFNPPLDIIDAVDWTYFDGNRVAILTYTGQVYCLPPDTPLADSPAAHPEYWGDRRALAIDKFGERGYTVISTAGEHYDYPR